MLSASVIAPDCRTADSWATALMVLGPAEGLRLIGQRPELEAWMVIDGPDGPHVESSVGAPAIVTSLLPPS